MDCQPGDDRGLWDLVLAHRPEEVREAVASRFVESGISARQVRAALDDGGDALHAAANSGKKDWSEPFGGPLAVALLAAEVSSLAAHINSRSSAVRALAVNELLDEFSAVTVAARLGVSRQKVYDLGRPSTTAPFIDRAPWRRP